MIFNSMIVYIIIILKLLEIEVVVKDIVFPDNN